MKNAINILATFIALINVLPGQSQSNIGRQQFKLWSWDGDHETNAYIRSTPGTTSPWGMSFWVSGQERLTINTSGTFNLRGNGSGGTLRLQPFIDNSESGIGLYTKSDGSGLPWVISQGGWNNTGKLVFGYDSGPKLTITQNGRVGVGTSFPGYNLEVAGTAMISGDATFQQDAYYSGRIIAPNEVRFTTASSKKGMVWGNTGYINYFSRIDDNVHLNILTDDSLFIGGINVTDGTPTGLRSMVIDNVGGFVGIGTSPKTKFDVNGDGRLNGNYLIGSDLARFNSIPAAKKALFGLWVEKGIVANDFAVGAPTTWADHVFAASYALQPLQEVARFIEAHHHLPGIPSEATIKKEGYTVHDMNTRFLRKIEELTLYTIQQQKEIDTLKKQLAGYEQLRQEIQEIHSLLKK